MFEKLQSVDVLILENMQCSYRYYDKYLALEIPFIFKVTSYLLLQQSEQPHFANFQTCNALIVHSIMQTGLQVTFHYNDKNNRCLPKLTNIHSSYRYNDK